MMALPIISADQRLAEQRGVKGVIFGKSGIGKTSLLWTLDAPGPFEVFLGSWSLIDV